MINFEDLRRLCADLAVDRVLTLGQVGRRYLPGWDEEQVRTAVVKAANGGRLVAWPEWVALTARARKIRRVDFVALRLVTLAPAALRHLCGIAEIRWQLGELVRTWDASLAPVLEGADQPDAVAATRDGLVAIEYDAGAYSSAQVRKKAQTFHAVFGRQVWGVPGPERARWLRPRLPVQADVFVAPWW